MLVILLTTLLKLFRYYGDKVGKELHRTRVDLSMEFWCFYIQPSQHAIHLHLPLLQLVISLVCYEINKHL